VIPLYKLEKLPRIQRLRKIAKYFSSAENRLCENLANKEDMELKPGLFSDTEIIFFTDAARLLAKDTLFPQEAQKLFEEAALAFQNIDTNGLRRAFNNVKHLLFAVTGKDQADWDFTASDGSLDSKKRRVFNGMQVYLEDIRSPFNVGAMFRTAESFGVEKIILSPFCADPRHRRAERTAMGCIDTIPWERQELFAPHEENKLKDDTPIFALETGGIPINEFAFPPSGILIAGSEELGVSPRALEAADASFGRVSIPIYGAKASLNVSTAFGIALQYWSKALI
jgi:TrmH family RNA methyltransferase